VLLNEYDDDDDDDDSTVMSRGLVQHMIHLQQCKLKKTLWKLRCDADFMIRIWSV